MRVLGSRTLVLTGTHAYPGSQFLRSGERTGLRPHLGDDLLGGGEADSGNLHEPVYGGLMLAQRLSHPGVDRSGWPASPTAPDTSSTTADGWRSISRRALPARSSRKLSPLCPPTRP